MIKPFWAAQIKAGTKTIEVKHCRAKCGPAFIIECGSYFITCGMTIWWCEGPLSEERWEELRDQHCVSGPRLYGATTFAWHVRDVEPRMCVPCDHTTQQTWVIYRGFFQPRLLPHRARYAVDVAF